nr:uncharacterized protein LOC109170332 [Ipomoea trifida]
MPLRTPRSRRLVHNKDTPWLVLLQGGPNSLGGVRSVAFQTDERVWSSGTLNPSNPPVTNSSTIAAIVTSLGGPPAAVGIVRLSRPSAVSIVGRLFRSLKKKKRRRRKDDTSEWRPKSHVVEYGVVSDSRGNVIDEI